MKTTKPESLGLSSERLARIPRFIEERYLAPGRLPCATVLVARRGEIAHLSIQGKADLARDKPLSEDSLFRIYSMTKPITSIAFMILVEEGKVALDDPVHQYIPAWRDLGVFQGGYMETYQTVRPKRPMLIVDLLRHTSGLTYGFQQRTNVDAGYRKLKLGEIEKAGTLDFLIESLGKLPLEFSPGDAWNYSVSTDVVGYLVEKISGQTFEDFLRTRIFKPLGMTETDFHAVDPNRLACNYGALPGGRMMLYDDAEKSGFREPPSFISGGGGLVSSIGDYYRFAQMLAGGGAREGVRLVSPKTLSLMASNHLPGGRDLTEMSLSLFSEMAYAGVGFGLGFAVTMDPARTMLAGTAGDFSWGGAASTYFWVDPKEELVVIFLTQLLPSSTYPIRREMRTLVYSAFEEANVK
ncbi:MAG: serine hydrolase [Alphaproteobacteria bacterium]|nr:serine hydrolase [Alphaproteobacteria bacterium]